MVSLNEVAYIACKGEVAKDVYGTPLYRLKKYLGVLSFFRSALGRVGLLRYKIVDKIL